MWNLKPAYASGFGDVALSCSNFWIAMICFLSNMALLTVTSISSVITKYETGSE